MQLAHRRSARATSGRSGGRVAAPRSEAGETLMELLATIVLMGVGVLGLLGALFTLVNVSDQVHQSSRANLAAHGYAEFLKSPYKSALQDLEYHPCPTAPNYPEYPAFSDLPDGYTAKITKIRTWNGNVVGTTGELQWNNPGACTAATDKGLQEITIEVKSGTQYKKHGSKETLVLIKRDQRCLVPYSNLDGKPC